MVGAQPAIFSMTPITFKTRFARSRASPYCRSGRESCTLDFCPPDHLCFGPHVTADRGRCQMAYVDLGADGGFEEVADGIQGHPRHLRR